MSSVSLNQKLLSQLVQAKILAYEYETSDVDEEMEILRRASTIIRREVDNMKNWQYKGSFDDFETPKKLLQLVRWITYGPHTIQVKREREAEETSRNLIQHIISASRTKRQINYESKEGGSFHKDKNTPLTVGLALVSYQANGSRSQVEMLQSMKTAVSYDEVERMTTIMAMALMDDFNDNVKGMYVPPFLKQGVRPLFAIDNIDWGGEVGPFHGADLLVAQKELEGNPLLGTKLKLNLSIKERALKQKLDMQYLECDKPTNPKVDNDGYKLNTFERYWPCL